MSSLHVGLVIWFTDVSKRQEMWWEWEIFDERKLCKWVKQEGKASTTKLPPTSTKKCLRIKISSLYPWTVIIIRRWSCSIESSSQPQYIITPIGRIIESIERIESGIGWIKRSSLATRIMIILQLFLGDLVKL